MTDFSFFKNPNFSINSYSNFSEKVLHFIISALFAMMFAVVGIIIIKVVDVILNLYFQVSVLEAISKKNNKRFSEQEFVFDCFYIIFLGPLIEEIIFRLPLNLKKWNVAIAMVMVCFITIGDKVFNMSFYSLGSWTKILAVVFVLLGFNFLKQQHIDRIKKNYRIYFYILVLSFGGMHIFNFYFLLPKYLVVFSPIFILPQLILGLFTSYIRIKDGFFWGLLLHICFNAPITLLSILSK
jgi:hypothetical protein